MTRVPGLTDNMWTSITKLKYIYIMTCLKRIVDVDSGHQVVPKTSKQSLQDSKLSNCNLSLTK